MYLCASKRNIVSKNLINKYVWLVETLYKAKKINLKEINRRWTQTELNEGEEIPRRTFNNWKNLAEEKFDPERELERINEYSLFNVELRPTFDFIQELLWNGETLEVLEPLWLRDEVAQKIQWMEDNYKTR